jgi:hypothetical protein
MGRIARPGGLLLSPDRPKSQSGAQAVPSLQFRRPARRAGGYARGEAALPGSVRSGSITTLNLRWNARAARAGDRPADPILLTSGLQGPAGYRLMFAASAFERK